MRKLGKYFWFFVIAATISLVTIFGAIYMSKNQIGLLTMMTQLLTSAGVLLYILLALGLYVYALWKGAVKKNTNLLIGSVLLMLAYVIFAVYQISHNNPQMILYTGWILMIPAIFAHFSR